MLHFSHLISDARGRSELTEICIEQRWHVAEKHIEIGDPILEPCPEIAVAHSQLIKIAEHRQIEFLFRFHNRFPCAAGTDPSMKFQAPTPLEAVCPGLLFP